MRRPKPFSRPRLAQTVVGDAMRVLHLLAYLRYRAFGTSWDRER